MSAVVVIPAGRSLRRSDNAKWVDPQPDKGTIEVNLDQGIVNFGELSASQAARPACGALQAQAVWLTPVWRNKATSRAEDELLIFPGEASFERVAAVSCRAVCI